MNRVLLSIRVSVAQDIMLKHIAKVRGITRYQALIRVIEIGLNSIMVPSVIAQPASDHDDIATRLAVIEALADRSLFTASAAYVYARRAALRGEGDAERLDGAMAEAVQSAYARQRSLAAEGLS
jgi:hypothetical protein